MSATRTRGLRSTGALALAITLGIALASCTKCRGPSDCDESTRCDLSTGECIHGCTRDEQCTSQQCDLSTGKCKHIDAPYLDTGIVDVGTTTTSTRADGG